MECWYYHAESDSYFLEKEDYSDPSGHDVYKLDFDSSMDEQMVRKYHRRQSLKNRFMSTNGEITKPKITNWADLSLKFRNLYDAWNVKVKHATNEYINLPQSPEADDILHFIFSKKKSLFELRELLDLFGDNKREFAENTINWLLDESVLLGYSFQDENFSDEWNFSETDKFSINVNYAK